MDKGPIVEIMGNYLNEVKDKERKVFKILPKFKTLETQMRLEGCCRL